jgi:TolB-like protein/Flp pilus assembly protein TadD
LGWLASEPESASSNSADLPNQGIDSRPAIAVLPFDNLSGDPEQEYFADGIAEDLITRLSSWRSFPVIARNSSFVYKGRAVDMKQVSRELGARYVVEGSVRRSGNRVRITAQLIDAPMNHHIWAETYDRELTDVFDVQDEISTAIAASTQGGLEQLEGERASRRDPADLDAWDLLQRARWHLSKYSQQDTDRAEELVTAALEIDPNLASGFALLAMIRYSKFTEGRGEVALEGLVGSARRAIELDPRDAQGYLALALALSLTGDRDEIRAIAGRAVELNPNMPAALSLLAIGAALEGRPDEGLARAERALRLTPSGPEVVRLLDVKSVIEVLAGDYAAADATVRNMIQRSPEIPWPHLYHAAILWHLGRRDEARNAFEEGRRLGPEISLELAEQSFSFLEPSDRAFYTAPLDALGLRSSKAP